MKRPADYGNGSLCPVEGHGRRFVLASGAEWCSHQSHDRSAVPAFLVAGPALNPLAREGRPRGRRTVPERPAP